MPDMNDWSETVLLEEIGDREALWDYLEEQVELYGLPKVETWFGFWLNMREEEN